MRTINGLAYVCLIVVATVPAAAAQGSVSTTSTDTPGITITRSITSGGITDLQRTRLTQKLALVDRIMTAVAGSDHGATVDQRQWLRERLYGTSLDQLQAIGTPSTFQAVATALSRSAVMTKDIGDAQTDLVYRPATPCRYIDTRNVGGPIVGSRDFDLANTGATYGGSGTCDPKSNAPGTASVLIGAMNINVTIVGPGTAPGFIGVRPLGATDTTSLVNWYQGGPTVQAANAGVVSTGGTGGLEFFGSPVNVVVDVLGIFTMPEHPVPKVVDTFTYIISPNTVGGSFPIPKDRPSQIVATVLTPGSRGVSQVTIFQCCGSTPTFLEWVGLHSPSNAAIASGDSGTQGTLILKMDFSGLMLLEVNDATSMRLHNTSGVTQSGVISIVEY